MKIAKGTKLPISIEEARNIIQSNTDSFGLYLDLDRILEYNYHYTLDLRNKMKELRNLVGEPLYNITERTATYNILVSRLGVPKALLTTPTGDPSVDKKMIEQCLNYYRGSGSIAEEFLLKYQDAVTVSKALSSFKSYKDLPQCLGLDRDNHRMVVAKPTWNILNTSRLSASNPGIQTIARAHADIITAPKGWQLVRSDSGQIEPRIMWSHVFKDDLMFNLIVAYNDAYFAYYDFVTMDKKREALLRENFEANFSKTDITQEMKDGRQQMKRISLAAGYGSSLPQNAGFDPKLARLYTEKIVNNPLRKEFERKIREDVYHGVGTFYGAFGSAVTPKSTDKYDVGGSGWTEHVIRCGINNPIQTTASELMIFAVNAANNILMTKCKNSHIAYYKHDEGCFYLHEDSGDMDYAEDLADCQSYLVEGWIPIYSEMEVGRKEPHNDVLRLF